jgi:hypothetical protein
MRAPSILAGLASAALLSGPADAKASVIDPARPVAFVCSVSGSKSLSPAEVCAVFKRKLDGAIARQTLPAKTWPAQGNAVRIVVRFAGERTVSAAASVRSAGKIRNVPELTQDVMDKGVGLRDLELLATQLMRAIAP